MVTVQVLDQTDDVQAEGEDDRADLAGLSRVRQKVNHLLNSSGAVHVEGDGDQIVGHGLADDAALFLSRVF